MAASRAGQRRDAAFEIIGDEKHMIFSGLKLRGKIGRARVNHAAAPREYRRCLAGGRILLLMLRGGGEEHAATVGGKRPPALRARVAGGRAGAASGCGIHALLDMQSLVGVRLLSAIPNLISAVAIIRRILIGRGVQGIGQDIDQMAYMR